MVDLEGFKAHIQFEEGMDDSMLSFYFEAGKKYAKKATGNAESDMSYYLGGIFWTYRTPESEMEGAFNAMTPLLLQEGLVKDDA